MVLGHLEGTVEGEATALESGATMKKKVEAKARRAGTETDL